MSSAKNGTPVPPRIAEWIIRKISWPDDRISICENLREDFSEAAAIHGTFRVVMWYWKQVLRSLFPFLKSSFSWSFVMLKSYFKIAFRHIIRHKGYAFLNLSGLVIGMVCSILIFFYVQDELGYDRFHKNGDNIHRVVSNLISQPAPLAPHLKAEYPEIENSVRILIQRTLINVKETTFFEDDFAWADNSLFEIFSLKFLSGDPAASLTEPFSVVLTEDSALKYFGKTDPIGQNIKIDARHLLKVTAVVENLPSNSTLRLSLIGALSTAKEVGINLTDWGNHIFSTYVLLNEHSSAANVTDKISNIVNAHLPSMEIPIGLSLQPLNRIHLYEEGHITNVYIFSAAAVFILLVAFINFINLTTARAENRALEVGVRKVTGAGKIQLVRQFLGESVIFSVTAFLTALLIARLLLPLFNNLSAKTMTWSFSENFPVFLLLFGISVLAGIAAGSYPALYLSSFHPAQVIRKIKTSGAKRSIYLRNILVIFQFALSIFLLISTMTVSDQMKFIRSKDLGYQKEQVVYLPINNEILKNRAAFQQQLQLTPGVLNATLASSLPTNIGNLASGIDWEGNEGRKNASWRFVAVEYDYIETLRLEMVAGRSFSREFSSDLDSGFIVNEEAVKEMELESPVGKGFSLWKRKGTIIGVVKNFHFRSMHTPITPLLIWMGARYPMFSEYFLARITPSDIPGTISALKSTWQEFSVNYPFEYGFLDESFERLYRSDERMGKVFGYFTVMAIMISCLGLLGLAAYTASLRTKEIGIRKVFGAPASGIIIMMSRPYLKWVLAANLIAWPAAFYFINQWLQGFAYRTTVSPITFCLSAAAAILIALFTVSFQSIKAALADPIDSLRYE